MKKIFLIDWILIPVFILSAFTGIELHIAGHGNNHTIWHDWAVFHVISSLFFLIGIFFHINTHWGWYKSFIKNGLGKKSHVTVTISVLFPIISVTGIALLIVEGANTSLGLWHYKISLVASILFLGHIIKRIPVLKKSLVSQTSKK